MIQSAVRAIHPPLHPLSQTELCCRCPAVLCAVRPGMLRGGIVTRLTRSERYLFAADFQQKIVRAYDLTSHDLPCVWSGAMGSEPCGMAVALQESVLIVARYTARDFLPVDIRATDPAAEWRTGATVDSKALDIDSKDGPSTGRTPVNLAYADGRLIVSDLVERGSRSVRICEVAMEASARDRPLSVAGAPLVTLKPICVIGPHALPLLTWPYALTTAVAPTGTGTRVFVSELAGNAVAELTTNGAVVRTFQVDGIDGRYGLAVAGGRLFAMSKTAVAAVAIADDSVRQRKAWQQLGWVLSESDAAALGLMPLSDIIVIDDMLIIVQAGSGGFVSIVQLKASLR
jgi:hypothetical protein